MTTNIGDAEANDWRDNMNARLDSAARLLLVNDVGTVVYSQPFMLKNIYHRRIEIIQTLSSGDVNGHLLTWVSVNDKNNRQIGAWPLSPPLDRRTGGPEYATVVNITTHIDF